LRNKNVKEEEEEEEELLDALRHYSIVRCHNGFRNGPLFYGSGMNERVSLSFFSFFFFPFSFFFVVWLRLGNDQEVGWE
jgi:hypothetical protein